MLPAQPRVINFQQRHLSAHYSAKWMLSTVILPNVVVCKANSAELALTCLRSIMHEVGFSRWPQTSFDKWSRKNPDKDNRWWNQDEFSDLTPTKESELYNNSHENRQHGWLGAQRSLGDAGFLWLSGVCVEIKHVSEHYTVICWLSDWLTVNSWIWND